MLSPTRGGRPPFRVRYHASHPSVAGGRESALTWTATRTSDARARHRGGSASSSTGRGSFCTRTSADPRGSATRLKVSGDGCGFEPEEAHRGGGLRLRWMRERAQGIGGTPHGARRGGSADPMSCALPLNFGGSPTRSRCPRRPSPQSPRQCRAPPAASTAENVNANRQEHATSTVESGLHLPDYASPTSATIAPPPNATATGSLRFSFGASGDCSASASSLSQSAATPRFSAHIAQ